MDSNLKRKKISIMGNTGVGKTSVITKFHNKNIDKINSTIGAEYTCFVSYDKKIALEIWDTAGQERFRSMMTSYFRSADACILLFDITQKKTFEDIDYWYNEIKKNNQKENIIIYLVANKIDLNEGINFSEEIEYAKKNNMRFFKTSLYDINSINNLFQLLINDLVEIDKKYNNNDNNLSGVILDKVVLDKVQENKNISCCL